MPARLISINRGGCFKVTASVNVLTEVVFLNHPPWLSINEAVAGPAALP
jgi:hypothetical protein